MKRLEMEIRDLLLGNPPIKIVTEEGMEEFGEIIDAQRDHVYGQIEVSDEGKLTSLVIDLDEIMEYNDISLDEFEDLSIEDLKDMAAEFVEEFGKADLQLTSFVEWGHDTFLLQYEAFDTKYNIPLPLSGATIEMTRQGFIRTATLRQSYYQLKYPTVEITPEEAKEVFVRNVRMELGAEKLEDKLVLMYYPKPIDEAISVTGEVIPLEELRGEESTTYKEIERVTPTHTFEQLVGITDDMQLSNEDGLVVAHMEGNEQQYVKIDRTDYSEITVESTLPFNEEKEFTINELRQRAIDFLENTVGDAHQKYTVENFLIEDELEDEEDDELTEEEIELLKELSAEDDEEEDDEEEWAFEPFVTFIFHRKLHGIKVDECNAHIDMGIYSGLVKEAVIPLLDQSYVDNMISDPALALFVADDLYKQSIDMKLARIPVEEEDFVVYELAYVVSDVEKDKKIERIDAQNATIFYVDGIEYTEE